MTLEELARAVGREICVSPEYRALVVAEKAYAGDKKAQELVKVAQEDGARLQAIKASGKPFSEPDQRKIVEVQAQISVNPSIQNLINAQKAYEALVQKANGWVQAEIAENRKKA